MISRRRFVELCFCAALARTNPASAQVADLPDRKFFRSGDLLWPVPGNACVALGAGGERTVYPVTRDAWSAERDRFLAENPDLPAEERERLQKMSYEDFMRLFGSTTTGQTTPLGATPRLGHVGILSVGANGSVSVLEAQTSAEAHNKPGVRQISYDQWLKTHEKPKIHHGRVRDLTALQAQLIADRALSQEGKPYNIMPSNLDDTSRFYCSKYVWWSVFAATGKALDGNPNPRRWGWVTPADLFRSALVDKLHDPGGLLCKS